MSFSLEAVFGVDTTGVRAKIKSLRRDFDDFVSSTAKLGAGVAVGAFVALSKGAIDLAGKLSDTSQNIGINVESLQALEAQHKRNGVGSDQLTKALEKTKAAVIAASQGDEKAAESLRKLGLSASELIRLPLDKQYEAIARGAAKAKDQNEAYAAVSALLGEKVGPKLMTSLRELADVGLPGVVKSAQEAGHVMSAETIAALDRAGDAIDDFKKKVTVAVGNIIVNFRTQEGMELLFMQVRKFGEMFVARIGDAIFEAGNTFQSVFGAAAIWLRERVQNGLVDAIEVVAQALNKVLPAKMQIELAGFEKLRVASEEFGDILAREIAETKPAGFTQSVEQSWNKIIAEQQKVVDEINKVDLGPAADQLVEAGNAVSSTMKREVAERLWEAVNYIPEAIDHGADSLERAGQSAAASLGEVVDEMKSAFSDLKVAVTRTGKGYADQSTVALEGVIARLNSQLQQINNRDFQQGASVGGRARSAEAYLIESELANARKELAERRSVNGFAQRFGEDATRRQFGDTLTDRALRDLQTSAQRTTVATEALNANLRALNEKFGISPKG